MDFEKKFTLAFLNHNRGLIGLTINTFPVSINNLLNFSIFYMVTQ